jgi:hypothetical protein
MKNTLSDIHNKLGLSPKNGLFIRRYINTSDNSIQKHYEGDFSVYKPDFKVEYALKKLEPHSFFVFNNEPLLLFFDAFDLQDSDHKRFAQTLSEKIWNFNKAAIAFVNFKTELVVYNGFQFDKNSNLLKVLETINIVTESSEKNDELEKLQKFSYWQIVSESLWQSGIDDFKKKTRVDAKLLENIKAAQEALTDKNSNNRLSEKHANRIIGRLIFVRYLIDRNVNLDYKGFGKELLTKNELPQLILQKENLFDFFNYLLNKFNGDILPLNGEMDAVQDNHLFILSHLFAGTNIASGQQSLFNIFDFDFIPIEFISNIYETFLGEKQGKDKAFYTPPFLVDYILEQTVKPHVENQSNINDLSCKTVDLTCGSGIFLCETLRTIINRYITLAKPDKSTTGFKEKIKQLLIDNIFGNDINEEAVEIAKFSLFITLLDYFENPKDIENFKFPDVSTNFFNQDIFDTKLTTENIFISQLDTFFGKEKLIEPDFIIGNPPWGKLSEKSPYLNYIKNRAKKENSGLQNSQNESKKSINIEISNKEFAQAFLLRLSDFSAKNTTCHIIVTSKLLYNLQANKFRNYFLNNFLINDVLEISSVRHQIFSHAVGPAAIIKYQYAFGKDTKENTIDYVSLKPNPYFAIFKSILIEKHDYKEIIQKELIKNDWLWKVLVYGHILDYRFVERLRDKRNFPITFKDSITLPRKKRKPTDKFFVGKGISIGNKSKPCGELIGKPFINTDIRKKSQTSDLKKFFIDFSGNHKWTNEFAERTRNYNLFKAPILLIKSGLNSSFEIESAISHIDATFTNSLLAVRPYYVTENSYLFSLCGLFNSKLQTYFLFHSGSSTGVEREQRFDEELYPFPIIFNDEIKNKTIELTKILRLISIHKKSSIFDFIKLEEYKNKFEKCLIQLNNIIFDLYKLSDTERDLIAYSQEITIPILQAKNKDFRDFRSIPKLYKPYKNVENSEIEDYITIFKEHFNKLHNGEEHGYFNVKVFQSKNILACEFSVDSEKHEDIWQNIESDDKALDLLVSLGFEKISNGLFIQKDIKTLKQNSFSVAKPKHYKYWHRAIARLDIIEFMEAMIESQIKIFNV